MAAAKNTVTTKGKGDEEQTKASGSPDPAKNPPPPPEEPKAVKRVRVIYEKGVLGHLRLTKGDETEDPAYVALLKEKGQRDVEAVK